MSPQIKINTCAEHCLSITEICWKSCNQFLQLHAVKSTLEVTVSSGKQGFLSNLVSVTLLHFFMHFCFMFFSPPSLSLLPSSFFLSPSHSDSCITLQLLFGCQIFYSFTVTLIQFRTKSQNVQPCRLPFSMTRLTITIYPEFYGLLYILHLERDRVGSNSFQKYCKAQSEKLHLWYCMCATVCQPGSGLSEPQI